MEKLKVGQILVSKEKRVVHMALSGEQRTIPEGNIVIVGADRYAHHLATGDIQPFEKDILTEGIVSNGIVEILFKWLAIDFPLSEMLAEHDIPRKSFKESMFDALAEIGIYKDSEASEKVSAEDGDECVQGYTRQH